MASPNGPALQLVPGALQDLSWPKVSCDRFLRGGRPGMVGESTAISWTVVMVLPSSGTLIFRLLDNELARCQNGRLSDGTAVSLREVDDRPTERAASLSEEVFGLDWPTGLFDDGQS